MYFLCKKYTDFYFHFQHLDLYEIEIDKEDFH